MEYENPMIDTSITMRQLCDSEPVMESFLQSKGFPFSLDNPIVDFVTFEDVCRIRGLEKQELIAEFIKYRETT